jgi:hypothetical protein
VWKEIVMTVTIFHVLDLDLYLYHDHGHVMATTSACSDHPRYYTEIKKRIINIYQK